MEAASSMLAPTATQAVRVRPIMPLAMQSAPGASFRGYRLVQTRPVRARAGSSTDENSIKATPITDFKHVLLPIMDRNPYLSEGTRQATSTTTTLAKKFGASITVVVIDEDTKESIEDHELRMKNIQWHLAEGGFEEYGLLEKLGEGKKPAAVIGEVADDMGLDLVVLSMEAMHSKHIDGNLLAEFVPCPVLLLPL